MTGIDVDSVLAEARERVRRKRAEGVYGPDLSAALATPLPGGSPILISELDDPVSALAGALEVSPEYDPSSRRPVVGVPITFARRAVIGLVHWWMAGIVDRQERVNQIVASALVQLRDRPSPGYGARLSKLEREWAARTRNEVAANVHSVYFQGRFGGDGSVIRQQDEAFIDLFIGRGRVLDLGCGRGIFLALAKDRNVGAYGVDLDPRMVEQATAASFEAVAEEALEHLRSLPDGSIDGLFARHVAEHVLPGELVDLVRELRRVLRPGSPAVLITPNPATLTVGAHTFWFDPSHLRPIPPELFRYYLEVEGFTDVSIRTFEPSAERLSEDVPEGPIRENVKLLNRTLFGDRDYAVVGFTPAQ